MTYDTPKESTWKPPIDTCHDWLHGKCARESCKFLHTEEPLDRVRFCKDHLAGKCDRGIDACKFYHGTQDQWKAQQVALSTQPHSALMGSSSYPTGPQEYIPEHICRDFIRGRCDRPGCRYLHEDPSKSNSNEFQGHTSRIPSHMCRDFVRGSCTRSGCRYSHGEDQRDWDSRPSSSRQRYAPY